jgi:nucleoside-diphosphate-sugar epimerase
MVDIAKAREKCGFEPQVTLEQGLTNTLNWYKQNRHVAHGG